MTIAIQLIEPANGVVTTRIITLAGAFQQTVAMSNTGADYYVGNETPLPDGRYALLTYDDALLIGIGCMTYEDGVEVQGGGASAEDVIEELERVGVLEPSGQTRKRFTLDVFQRMPFPKFNHVWSKSEKELALDFLQRNNKDMQLATEKINAMQITLKAGFKHLEMQFLELIQELLNKSDSNSQELANAINGIEIKELVMQETQDNGDIIQSITSIKNAVDNLRDIIIGADNDKTLSDIEIEKIKEVIFNSPLKRYNKFMSLGALVNKSLE